MASIQKRPEGTWRARYRDGGGREHSRHFRKKVDAQRWLDEVTASVVTGLYVAPSAGKMTFREYAETWRVIQPHRLSSQKHVEHVLFRHAYPVLGDRTLSSILPSDIQSWVKGLERGDVESGRRPLAPNTIGVLHSIVFSIMKSAVRDRRVMLNPCEGTRLPKPRQRRIVPLTTLQVARITEQMPLELRAMVTLAAGTGMRQGECLGLTRDKIDFAKREVTVDQQLVTVSGIPPYLGPPKTAASDRVIPLPQVVVDALAAHVTAFRVDDYGFVFTIDDDVISRQKLGHAWRRVVDGIGVPKGVGFHALRHYYASLLIRHGESVKTVQARLGHASAVETLDTYSHLWPDSEDRTRDAVDDVLGNLADYLRTDDHP